MTQQHYTPQTPSTYIPVATKTTVKDSTNRRLTQGTQ